MRKAGKQVEKIERKAGGDRKSEKYQKLQTEVFDSTDLQSIKSRYGEPRVTRWQLVTKIPQEEHEELVAAWRSPQKNKKKHATKTTWLNIGAKYKHRETPAEIGKSRETIAKWVKDPQGSRAAGLGLQGPAF
jgi:hypothetical protein